MVAFGLKGGWSKWGKKLSEIDDSRRSTYDHPIPSDSMQEPPIFATFDSDRKVLIPVSIFLFSPFSPFLFLTSFRIIVDCFAFYYSISFNFLFFIFYSLPMFTKILELLLFVCYPTKASFAFTVNDSDSYKKEVKMGSFLQLYLINQSKVLVMLFFTMENSETWALLYCELQLCSSLCRDWSLSVLLLVYKLKKNFINAYFRHCIFF